MPFNFQQPESILAGLLTLAWLLPLMGFVVEIFGGYWGKRTSRLPAWIAVGCISTGFVLSLTALGIWSQAAEHPVSTDSQHENPEMLNPLSRAYSGTYYRIAQFGEMELSLDYYIDGLTLVMFVMITLIATCIHLFAIGYLSNELTDDHEDHAVILPDGHHLHRPGRFYQFFAYLSLFCFAMLGLVLSGNLFQVFVFWELVGICSYLLIGFYTERTTANIAANKAFIMNRVGDFGFLIGLMILWTSLGALHFVGGGDAHRGPGLFEIIQTHNGVLSTTGEKGDRVVSLVTPENSPVKTMPYWLLTAAGLGIFAGCVGKSAQFPLQTWLPDAMAGPTPVSALVHSATMVAAGVYLVGRFYPLLTPEALLTIAYIGCATLFIGATIALVVTDIKQVLACSTMSQLGYMMLALGVGGWIAGLFHLVTHAFFKSLLFLCAGSVIHGCHHEQDMTRMGGLRKKMPITCWTMFVGVVAICGLAIPLLPAIPGIGAVAFSGYHSKDSILATSLAFASLNPSHSILFLLPLLTAGLTAFYMFRMWFMTFFGDPKSIELHEKTHDPQWTMLVPLFVLAFFAMTVGVAGEDGPLVAVLRTAEPIHVASGIAGEQGPWIFPSFHHIHEHHLQAGAAALTAAFSGTILAYLFYAIGIVDMRGIQKKFAVGYRFLLNYWQFDTLYRVLFIRPIQVISGWCVSFDRYVLDASLDRLSKWLVTISGWDRRFDESVVDRTVSMVGQATWKSGDILRRWQTGYLRHYVMSISVSLVVLFILLFLILPGR